MKPLSELLTQERSRARAQMRVEPVAVRRAAEGIRRRWPNVEAIDCETDAEALALEMERRRRNGDWLGFYWADTTRTANAFLSDGLWRERRFGDLYRFLLFQIGPDAQSAYLRTMFRKYLETFDPESKLTRDLAEVLKSCWSETGLRIERLVHHFDIFDISAAPHRKIAAYMNTKPISFDALRKEGVEAPHGAGLMQLAHRCFVSIVAPRIADGDSTATEKLLNWLNPGGDRKPLQGPAAGAAIDALLLPWSAREPDQKLKNTIETRLIGTYEDLRTKEAGVWRACSGEARRVILKWLTGATVEVFFDIVTEADHSHMWSDRKNLWVELFKEGRISQAWFALSEPGADIARRFNQEREGASLAFARNESRGSPDRMKCLLIMNVDDRWVVEGSHSFPTWVFPPGNLSTLTPYEERYTCEKIRHLRGPEQPERLVHSNNWRNRVLMALQR